MIKAILLILSATLAGIFWYCSPILKPFPMPTGTYKVGFQTLPLVDERRIESFEKTADKRTIMVHIWYPATPKANQVTAPYLGNKKPYLLKAFADFYRMPLWIAKLLFRNIQTHSYTNAPLSSRQDAYPVILYSHGLFGEPSDTQVSFPEDLASHGYIVIGIDHPYFNLMTLYPNGRILSSQKLQEQFQKMSPAEQYAFQNRAIEIYKADMSFVIDQLTTMNQNPRDFFYNHLDLFHIGIMGHSAGGTAAIEVCRVDKRCKAVVDMDGWYDQAIGYSPLEQPLLLLFGSTSNEVSEPTTAYLKRKGLTRDQYFERERKIAEHKKALCSNENCSMVIIPNASHSDFGDGALYKWPLRAWNASDSYKTIGLIRQYLLDFFDRYLKNQAH